MGGEHKAEISEFMRKNEQHNGANIVIRLSEIFDFAKRSYDNFAVTLIAEIQKREYIENRYHKLFVFQQYLKNNLESSFSLAYIDATDTAEKMPDSIQVLLLCRQGEEILAKNCPFDTI